MQPTNSKIVVSPADLKIRMRRARSLTNSGAECTECGGLGGWQIATDQLRLCDACQGDGSRQQEQPRIHVIIQDDL